MSWKDFLKGRNGRIETAISLIMLSIVLFTLSNFLNFVEGRQGVVLPDPLLNLFEPVDLTWLTFALIYISLIVAVISLAKHPRQLLFAIQLYSLMVFLRIIAMYLVPLEPPSKMIILNDPFVEFFGTGQTLTKDLFFSGHTATLFLLFLVSQKKIFKFIFLICTIAVGISVLLQHVHYTIDVVAAVIFTYSAFNVLKNKSWMINE